MTKGTEEFKISGSDVVSKIKELIQAGNIRKITIKDKGGKVFAEFPLTIGVVGTVILPVAAAISTIIALVADCTISVEKEAADKEVLETEEAEGKDKSDS